ncbi:Agamous MADS-box protein AGL62 [Spatholobus suberectus]|nr:Agamous MADS-box protein AGL62 [Spatholobus suberectus]
MFEPGQIEGEKIGRLSEWVIKKQILQKRQAQGGRVEVKKVEQINRRHVTFSKRKLGLFNKLTELSLLCNVETALIVTSQNGKLYSCGYPDADAVVRRYLAGGPPQRTDRASRKKRQETIETLRLEYEAVQNQLKEEKKRLQAMREAQKSGSCFPSWWNQSTEGMSLESLEQFKASLERLKFNLVGAVQGKQLNSVPSMPPADAIVPSYAIVSAMTSAMVPPPQLLNMSPLTQRFSGTQVQDYRRSGASTGSTTFPASGFGRK